MRRTLRLITRFPRSFHWPVNMSVVVFAMLTGALASASPRDPKRVVFVLQDQSPAQGVLLAFDSMQGQLGELQVDIASVHLTLPEQLSQQARQAAEVAAQKQASAVFWFVGRAGGLVRVCALHAPSGRVFARDVSLGESSAVQREQLAIVLRAAVPAILDGGRDLGDPLIVVSPAPDTPTAPEIDATFPPAPSQVPETGAAGASKGRVRLALGYFGSSIASRANWQSGTAGELLLESQGGLRGSFGAGYAAPTRVTAEGAVATIFRIPLSARLGAMHRLGRATLGIEAGALLDVWHRETVVHSDALAPTDPTTAWRFGGTIAARFDLAVAGSVGLYCLGEVQWLPVSHALRVRSAQGNHVLPTYAFRPGLGVGVTFDLGLVTGDHAEQDNSIPLEATAH